MNSTATMADTQTLLVCIGKGSSYFGGMGGGTIRHSYTLTKSGDQVISVKAGDSTVWTLKKTNVKTKDNKGPVYRQLVVEKDRLVLRTEVTEDNRSAVTIINNDGGYYAELALSAVSGHCSVSKRIF